MAGKFYDEFQWDVEKILKTFLVHAYCYNIGITLLKSLFKYVYHVLKEEFYDAIT